MGRDANNGIYPIAWAVVRIEEYDTWSWFIQKLKDDLCLGQGENITIISDKQKGLVNAVHSDLPLAHHRMCARHIYANWKKTFKGLKVLFYKIAKSYHERDYAHQMEELRKIDPLAYDALVRTQPEQWSRAFFLLESRCDDVQNNLSESFNSSIKDARIRPIIDMFEEIRRQTMGRIAKRAIETAKYIPEFPPRILTTIRNAQNLSRNCSWITSGNGKYEVTEFGICYAVDLHRKSCACRKWDLSGIPCQHAITVINGKREKLSNYVSEYYSKAKWQETYQQNLLPVNGEPMWKKVIKFPITVPSKRVMPGRPKKFKRKKDAHESPTKSQHMTRHGRKISCSRCRESGHNVRSCNNESLQVQGPKRRRGRPKKSQGLMPSNSTFSETSQIAENARTTQPSQQSEARPQASSSARPSTSTRLGSSTRPHTSSRTLCLNRPARSQSSMIYLSPHTGRPFQAPRRERPSEPSH
ncbi:PREDICTED: uncharacterized protein LOC104818597 isoform X1 [Tarenaya hassleriana]|uniref:uncharacterized protein LOC104818597 isoform X1 n=1 Tax=Tarenaya hassleriana TaxID=28532 RepID=UPI00053C93A5|nr:PREDICTED: uncharacterized protein LOC104818597 isoform X1 [Tarenaya hassleriana]